MFATFVKLSLTVLSALQDVVPDWQTAASSLLTTLGLRYADKVLAELMLKFPPGGHPHYFVVRSLGLLAVANGKEKTVLNVLTNCALSNCFSPH